MAYPTLKQVEAADRFIICGWHRFLGSPANDEQKKILDRICERYGELGGMTPEISKRLGWG